MKFHIWSPGSQGVGIPGRQVVVDWCELSESELDREEMDFIKRKLRWAFIDIFDDKNTRVMTDKEYEDYTREDNES